MSCVSVPGLDPLVQDAFTPLTRYSTPYPVMGAPRMAGSSQAMVMYPVSSEVTVGAVGCSGLCGVRVTSTV